MEYTCDECYEMRQVKIGKCPRCGKHSWVSRVIWISSVSECKECGWGCVSAGGFQESCHEDNRLYSIYISKPNDKYAFAKLARILNINILELNKSFVDGQIEMKYKVMECLEKEKQISDLGMTCRVSEEVEKQFSRIKSCPYARNEYNE